ncbi:hypothetical protein PAPHI01_1464 [Pancytospora philotis]|nr:hypothetical protein PAPHI01_1464 [Pancytospora philotis]
MDIAQLLGLRHDASRESVKLRYYRKLAEYHPDNRNSGDQSKFAALIAAYKKHLTGEDFVNCYGVVANSQRTHSCRCDGIYEVPAEYEGRIDCDYCSCFIIVEQAPLALSGISTDAMP